MLKLSILTKTLRELHLWADKNPQAYKNISVVIPSRAIV